MTKPLEGIRVLDCSTLLPGPYCTMMLRAMGAEVIKVEPPGNGDFLRKMLPECFAFLNRGKRSIVLNLKSSEGREVIARLAKTADVIIEGFRPGVAERLGINFEVLRSVNPNIIYVSISGYGQTGPYAGHPGHDVDYQAISGLVSVTGDPEQSCGAPAGFQASDIAGGIFALISILAALLARKIKPSNNDEGTYLDVSMTDGLITWMLPRIIEYFAQGAPSRSDFMARGPYGIFTAKDGRHLALGVVEEHFWERLCQAMGFADLLEDPELQTWKGRNRNHRRIVPRLREVLLTRDRDEWLNLFREADIPASCVNEIKDMLTDPQTRHRRILGVDENGQFSPELTCPFPVPTLTESLAQHLPPELGEDTASVLESLGFSEGEIRQMQNTSAALLGRKN